MANLRDKMRDLLRQVRTNLDDAVGYADETGNYQDFEKAMKEIWLTEKRLKTVRAQVRTMMRKTKPAFQAACPHTNKVDVRVLQNVDGKRIVEEQRCTGCSKSFEVDAGYRGTEPIIGRST